MKECWNFCYVCFVWVSARVWKKFTLVIFAEVVKKIRRVNLMLTISGQNKNKENFKISICLRRNSSLRPLFWHFGDLDLLKLDDVVLLDVVPVHGHDDDEDQHEQEE